MDIGGRDIVIYLPQVEKIYLFLLLQQGPESGHQVVLQILPVLQPDADSQESPVDLGVSHRPPLDQSLHSTQTRSMVEERQLGRQFASKVLLLHHNGEDRTKAVGHLLLQPREVVFLQACVVDLVDSSLRSSLITVGRRALGVDSVVEPSNETLCVLALPLDTDFKRAQTSDTEPALHAAHDAS